MFDNLFNATIARKRLLRLHSFFAHLEYTEDLLDVQGLVDGGKVLQHVEANSLRQRTALTDSHQVTFLNIDEAWRAVHSHVLVTLFESNSQFVSDRTHENTYDHIPSVLRDVLQIVSADDHSSFHLGGDDNALQDTSTNGDVASKWAFLVNVVSINGLLGGLESKTNVLVKADSLQV